MRRDIVDKQRPIRTVGFLYRSISGQNFQNKVQPGTQSGTCGRSAVSMSIANFFIIISSVISISLCICNTNSMRNVITKLQSNKLIHSSSSFYFVRIFAFNYRLCSKHSRETFVGWFCVFLCSYSLSSSVVVENGNSYAQGICATRLESSRVLIFQKLTRNNPNI